MKYILSLYFSLLLQTAFCQNNFGIGTNTPSPDAILELKSNNQGVLIPRLSTTQRLAIVNPSNGLMVYDSNFNCFFFYVSSAAVWRSVCPGPTGPTINANTQTYSSTAVATYITDTVPVTVNGLSLAVTLTDTATVILTSTGTISYWFLGTTSKDTEYESVATVQLYENSSPIIGTYTINNGLYNQYGNWSLSTVLSLLPGTYLFELRSGRPPYLYNSPDPPPGVYTSQNFWAGAVANFSYLYNHNYTSPPTLNQGIITAQVIYK